jgi:hypothetical protein
MSAPGPPGPSSPRLRLRGRTGVPGDWFGYSVSISSDGSYAIVGAWLDDVTYTDQVPPTSSVAPEPAGPSSPRLRLRTRRTSHRRPGSATACPSRVTGPMPSRGRKGRRPPMVSPAVPPTSSVRSGTSWTFQSRDYVAPDPVVQRRLRRQSVSISSDGSYAIAGAQLAR